MLGKSKNQLLVNKSDAENFPGLIQETHYVRSILERKSGPPLGGAEPMVVISSLQQAAIAVAKPVLSNEGRFLAGTARGCAFVRSGLWSMCASERAKFGCRSKGGSFFNSL